MDFARTRLDRRHDGRGAPRGGRPVWDLALTIEDGDLSLVEAGPARCAGRPCAARWKKAPDEEIARLTPGIARGDERVFPGTRRTDAAEPASDAADGSEHAVDALSRISTRCCRASRNWPGPVPRYARELRRNAAHDGEHVGRASADDAGRHDAEMMEALNELGR
ncbi:MAG: hypothetical protein HPM95_17330 [Alphaproteobacteria bacterium]|nr:hypothetical protein [Alphaproteobacteria bacterium]